MRHLARLYCWWPTINTDIEQWVDRCSFCQKQQPKSAHQPLHQWDVPAEVWTRIHVDFAGPIDGQMYLALIDAQSHWPEIIPVCSINAVETIAAIHDSEVDEVSENPVRYDELTEEWERRDVAAAAQSMGNSSCNLTANSDQPPSLNTR
ncbi:hypothetical protein GJ496_001381 [Pomphorhynchus laevis]|nr:hypothetical protein GJ496_001381 [Pomphorhynchus laevis]